MKIDEIKEILDELKAIVESKDYENGLVYIEHSYLKAIHYYITNLQEKLKVSQTNEETYKLEMQDITKILGLDEHTIFDEVKEYAINLQEEKEKEHYLVDKLTRQLTDEYKNTEYQCKQKEDYKSRIEKAIEYIKEHQRKDELLNLNEWQTRDLLNILNGGDE